MLQSDFHKRTRPLNSIPPAPGAVAYIMARDNRVQENWALAYAQQLALEYKSPLLVIAPIAADYPGLSKRQRWFLLEGLKQVGGELKKLNLPFLLISKKQVDIIAEAVVRYQLTHLVLDFNPLKASRRWKERLAKKVNCAITEVDAHNIVPVWEVSDKQEFAAYTLRPKINRRLNEFLVDIPAIVKHPNFLNDTLSAEPMQIPTLTGTDILIPQFWKPGSANGYAQAEKFLAGPFQRYHIERNDPNADCQSELSPYLHFGQISAQTIVLMAYHHETEIAALESFLEELIVRRELSDNFCNYNSNYDSCDGFPNWARITLGEHQRDPRPELSSFNQLRGARTGDDLWNAAQKQMLYTGKMHGYLRMYWAKKILEWTDSPEQALNWANKLNDDYSLDGSDPNGYVGTAWSIGGVHDRAWPERDLFGKIRYMNYNGCKRKFNISRFVSHVAELETRVKR